jgi:hypothetical protein
MNNDSADYYGNLAGDLAWTIEPFCLFFSNIIMAPFVNEFRSPTMNKDPKKED